MLQWNGLKRGLSDMSPIHMLSRFLGKEWLSSTDKNDMLEILRGQIAADLDLAGRVRVEVVELTAKITAAFKHRETKDYMNSRWIRSLGADVFECGEHLITITHLGVHSKQMHWVTIKVDGPQCMLRYGDSLGQPMPPTLRQAYKWWAAQHTADAMQFSTLPMSTQIEDHSCGMLTANAALHTIYLTIPLMQQANIVLERLQMFITLAKQILDRVSALTVDKRLELSQNTGLG
jgi:hypothetical protein